jgi:hypothetical protein
MSRPESLEWALSQLERETDAAMKTVGALAAQLKRAKRAAAEGAIRDLGKALSDAASLAAAARDAVSGASGSWRFDTESYMASGGFAAELVALGQDEAVPLQEQDGLVVSYPSLVRILPRDEAIEIDRKRRKDVRPSRVIAYLKAARDRPSPFKAQPFLEALFHTYRLVAAEASREIGETVVLLDLYKAMTVLPGQSSLYTRQEFARDIYLLDESGVDVTKDGHHLSLHAASGARTSSALPTVTRDGNVKLYYAIAFTP